MSPDSLVKNICPNAYNPHFVEVENQWWCGELLLMDKRGHLFGSICHRRKQGRRRIQRGKEVEGWMGRSMSHKCCKGLWKTLWRRWRLRGVIVCWWWRMRLQAIGVNSRKMHDWSLVSSSSPTLLTLLTSTQLNHYGTCSRIESPIFQGLQIPLTNFGRQLKRYGRRSRQTRLESSLGLCQTELRLSQRQKDGIQSIDLADMSEIDVYTQIYKHELISPMPSQKQLVWGGDDWRGWWQCPETFRRHKYTSTFIFQYYLFAVRQIHLSQSGWSQHAKV